MPIDSETASLFLAKLTQAGLDEAEIMFIVENKLVLEEVAVAVKNVVDDIHHRLEGTYRDMKLCEANSEEIEEFGASYKKEALRILETTKKRSVIDAFAAMLYLREKHPTQPMIVTNIAKVLGISKQALYANRNFDLEELKKRLP